MKINQVLFLFGNYTPSRFGWKHHGFVICVIKRLENGQLRLFSILCKINQFLKEYVEIIVLKFLSDKGQ